MTVRLEHVGLWVKDLERVTAFYQTYFGARSGALYENPRKGFASRFLEFAGGARLEVMRRIDLIERSADDRLGWAHLAICVGDEAAVDALAGRLAAGGFPPIEGPRRTGDGYYECVVRDPEGNRVEIMAG
jgi:lactoylglutathione lyase